MSDDLKPCPFCGSTPADYLDHGHSTGWIVSCLADKNCPIRDVEMWAETKAEAFAAWNIRASDATIEQLQRELDEVREASLAVLADWDKRLFRGEQERFVPTNDDSELGGYWSPQAAMVSSEKIAALRAALAKMEANPRP